MILYVTLCEFHVSVTRELFVSDLLEQQTFSLFPIARLHE